MDTGKLKQKGDFKKAWELVEYIYSKDQAFDDHKIKIWAARCYLELLEPENALNFVELYIKNAGISADVLFIKGIVFIRLGRIDDAQGIHDELNEMLEGVPELRAIEIMFFVKTLQKELDSARKHNQK